MHSGGGAGHSSHVERGLSPSHPLTMHATEPQELQSKRIKLCHTPPRRFIPVAVIEYSCSQPLFSEENLATDLL